MSTGRYRARVADHRADPTSDAALLTAAADAVEALARRTTGGDWRRSGLLAVRPEVVAHDGGGTEHVAEARARTAAWITTFSPALATPLAAWLRAAAAAPTSEAVAVARVLLDRAP